MNDHEIITVSALRYALGRRSYIMSITEDYIRKIIQNHRPSKAFIHVCIQDIEGHYKDMERLEIDTGGMHDWNPLLETLKAYI